MKQILSTSQREKIRKILYRGRNLNKNSINPKDEKIKIFQRYSKGKDVLDIGSVDHDPKNMTSDFWLFKSLIRVANSVIGLDYYKPGVNAMIKEGYKVLYADAQDFKIKKKFDVITIGDLIEHVPNPGNVLKCAKLHLKDDGFVIISTPNVFCWKYMLYHSFFGNSDAINREHVSWYCKTTLEWLADRYSFKLVETMFVSRRWWEKIIPLPPHLRHPTLVMVFTKSKKIIYSK